MNERETQNHDNDLPYEVIRAELEARNGYQQYKWALSQIEKHIKAESYVFDSSFVRELNRLAVLGIRKDPGELRTRVVRISNSKHIPPPPEQVPGLLDEMISYVNKNWTEAPIHLGAYLMWRVNWIHPFGDGNGRTSRMTAYAVLCIRLGCPLEGTKTIPDQIAANKQPYYDALDQADQALKEGRIDVTAMEELLSDLLATQLAALHDKAMGL